MRNGTPAVDVQIQFRLLWGSSGDSGGVSDADHGFQTELKPAGEGLDPGRFDVDINTGKIDVAPRSNGNYSMFLVAVDVSTAQPTVRHA